MTEKMSPPYSGQCLCGTIKYRVDAIESRMGHCHCTMCRKFHGSAFATFGEAKTQNFHWLAGEANLKSYVGHNNSVRQFCATCGSSLTFAAANSDGSVVEFTLGTLDDDIDERPEAHVFTQYKANWFDILDDLPKYSNGRDNNLSDR
jgi:hypothetical protein